MQTPEQLRSYARQAKDEAAMWANMARQAVQNAKRFRKYAADRAAEAEHYAELAERESQKINAEFEGIAA
ncbi:MAG: hypothetical protein QHC90_13365 [Shinella sp.]|nr:hypothetical protein [Shinella sp.]